MTSQKQSLRPLRDAINEVRACFGILRVLSDRIGQQSRVTSSMRAILEYLADTGDATVPEVAHAKRHTRQSVQALVDALIEIGLVTTRDNPHHRRSSLLAITPRGREEFGAILEREDALLREFARLQNPKTIEALAPALREFRIALEHAAEHIVRMEN